MRRYVDVRLSDKILYFFTSLSQKVSSHYHTKSKMIYSTHDGLQDADGVDARSAPGRGGGGIAAVDECPSEASGPVADFCAVGAYCGV